MKRIVYVGAKERKFDNVAQTGLEWARGQVQEVQDDKKAAKLLEHRAVWQDADQPYEMQPVFAIVAEGVEPRVTVVPMGGEFATPFWEPITIPIDKDVFLALQKKEVVAIFAKPEDADEFAAWKKAREDRAAIMRAAKAAKKEDKEAA